MRIAVYHNLPSGGAKRALFGQISRLNQRHELDVYTLSQANHAFANIHPFVKNYHIFDFQPAPNFPHPFGLLNYGTRLIDIYRLRRLHQKIAAKINHNHYDLVLVHSDQITQSPPLLEFLTPPSVYYCHDVLRKVYDPPLSRPYSRLQGLRFRVDNFNPLKAWYFAAVTNVDKTSLQAATLVLVNSRFSQETVYRLYAVSPRVCYLGIDTDTFKPVPLAKAGYVLSVGAIAPPKGFDFIINSMALIPAQIRPPLVIAGNFVNPNERAYLEKLAQAGHVRVEFQSQIQDTELAALYSQARLTLYAPVLEPFGLVPLESMACGTPVVGVAEGGVRETIRHNETGLLTDRDPQQFAEAVSHVLGNTSLATRLGKQGPAYVKNCWSWEASLLKLESFLTMTANGRTSPNGQGQHDR